MHLRLVETTTAAEAAFADRVEREVRSAIDRIEALAHEAGERGELLDELAVYRLKDELAGAFDLLLAVSE